MTAAGSSPQSFRYQAVLLAILDFQIDRQSGHFVCDGYDATYAYFTGQKDQTKTSFQRGRLDALKRQLTRLLKAVFPDVQDSIAGYVQDKTGYRLEDLAEWQRRWQTDETKARPAHSTRGYTERTEVVQPDGTIHVRIRVSTGARPDHFEEQEVVSPDGRSRVWVSRWRKGANASISVTLILPKASGAVYGTAGIWPEIRATWADNTTILIETDRLDTTGICYHEIRSFGEIFRIEYKEVGPDLPAGARPQ